MHSARKREPYAVIREPEAKQGWEAAHFHERERPPLRIGLLLGDFFYNLRSALDHLAWQLVLLDGGAPGDRLERGLSQHELAGAGVCSAHVSAIETGHRQAALQTLRVIAARLGVIPELLETGRSQTISDALAQAALRRPDGALWIVLTPAGVTFTWQEGGERYQLDRPGDNLTEGLLALAEVADELTRLDAAEAEAQRRRRQILQQRRAPD